MTILSLVLYTLASLTLHIYDLYNMSDKIIFVNSLDIFTNTFTLLQKLMGTKTCKNLLNKPINVGKQLRILFDEGHFHL